MATNLDIITSAYRKVNIINQNEVPSAEQAVEGLEMQNDLMAEWEENGIEIGHFPQTSTAATAPYPDHTFLAVKTGIGIALAGIYKIDVPSATAAVFGESYRRLRQGTSETPVNSFDHMPMGRRGRFNINSG